MRTVRSIRNIAIAAVVAGLTFAGSTSAMAEPSPAATEMNVEMHAIKLTAESATAYGYDVRTDTTGQLWATDPGAPEGDFSHGVQIPDESDPSTLGLVAGNCGTAYVYFINRASIRTGYIIATPWGQPLSQTWNVAVHSSIDFGSYPFSGLATLGSQSWEARSPITTQALNGQALEALAGGSVLTTGGICVSGSPTASINY